MKYEDLENGLFANAQVEKNIMGNVTVVSAIGKHWSENQWFFVGAGQWIPADPAVSSSYDDGNWLLDEIQQSDLAASGRGLWSYGRSF
jgi:hypothetical protein